MYEDFRNRFATALAKHYDGINIGVILATLDSISSRYRIEVQTTELDIYMGGIPDELKMYLVSMKLHGLADGTLKNYRLNIESFFREVRKPVAEITTNDIRAYLYAYRQMKTISDRTADKYREYLNGFFEWCVSNDYINKNPVRNVEKIKFEIKPREHLSHLELEYLREACQTNMEKAIVEMLFSTGCRIAELATLKKSDIDFFTREVHLFGKGKKHRTSYLNAKAIVALSEYLDTRTDDCEYLIIKERGGGKSSPESLRGTFKKIVKRSELNRECTPHHMRHTTATLALQSGMKIDEVSKLLGHENIATTMIYAKTSEGDLKQSHSKFLA